MMATSTDVKVCSPPPDLPLISSPSLPHHPSPPHIPRHHLVIVTGAGRGFGKAVAAAFATRVRLSLHLVLVGRVEADLEDTVKLCYLSRGDRDLHIRKVLVGDMSSLSSSDTPTTLALEELANELFQDARDVAPEFLFSDVTFVDNAGSLGPIAPIGSDAMSLDAISRVATLNYVVPAFLASEFVKKFSRTPGVVRMTVAHVSSLWAVRAQSCFATYCSSKAGIEMFLQVLSEEKKTKTSDVNNLPSCKVINYAPGPLDTDMQQLIRTAPDLDEPSRQMFSEMKATNKLVDPAVSANKFARLVIEELYVSGSHVDFYDEIEGIEKPLSRQTTCCACVYCECGPACQCKPMAAPQCDSCSDFVAAAKQRKCKPNP
jgi:sepiapterin reductase